MYKKEYRIPGLSKFELTTRSIQSDRCVLNFDHDGVTMRRNHRVAWRGNDGTYYGQSGNSGGDGAPGTNGLDGTIGI